MSQGSLPYEVDQKMGSRPAGAAGLTHRPSETRALSLPCKGGPGGGRINQLRRHRIAQAKPCALSPPCKGGARGGEGGGGRINQLRRHRIAQAKPAHFPPLAKGGPGGVGAGSTSSVATASRKRNPRAFPPLQRQGQGGGGRPTNPVRSPPVREIRPSDYIYNYIIV